MPLAAALLLMLVPAYGQQQEQQEEPQVSKQRPPMIVNPADQPVFEEIDEDIFTADWLLARRGRYRFEEGLITVDPEHLRRFLITDMAASFLRFGKVVVETRPGKFISSEQEPDDSLDIPASVLITYKGRRMAGAKGYRLGAEVVDNGVEITHWSGKDGCAIKTWLLQFAGERMIIKSIKHTDLQSKQECEPAATSAAAQ
ncbi:MAG: hypothetical protein OXC81_08015 [Betaproteobacteria bacterium]|nr:hypothetical protein [Betaproteobacteria bacterium]